MKTTHMHYMKKKGLIRAFLVAALVLPFSQSCTNLDENIYSVVTPDNYGKTEEEIISLLGDAYQKFSNWASGDGTLALQEVSTDEMVVPTRGSDWDDGGNWRRLHLHTWTYEDYQTNDGWNFGFEGVTTANRLIFMFQTMVDNGQMTQDVAKGYLAELKTIRGFFYYYLLDTYGNVPLVTDFATADPAPPTVARNEVYAWLVADLEAAVPDLPKTVDATTYARMNYWAGKFLLAKLYLNAKVYSGTAQWQKAADACDEIINSGKFNLEANYFKNFNVDNGGSGNKEIIFAIPYDQVFFGGFNIAVRTLHYGSQDTYNLTAQPWNGFCSLEEFYNSYEDADVRKGEVGTLVGPATKRGNFLAGYQYKSDGTLAIDAGADGSDPDGTPINFGNMGTGQPQINELGPQSWRQSGVRVGKWEIAMGSHPDAMSNDYAVYRYADVLLMKAEASWRVSGSATDAAALTLVNQVRNRAGVAAITTLDGPVSFDMAGPSIEGGELFNEIGREMFAENWKRSNLIRWGLYTKVDKWAIPHNNPGDHVETGDFTNLFPIYRAKLTANPNLQQNPGYEQ
jgi:starch-binding outer membrane protein, SusD/RagB family